MIIDAHTHIFPPEFIAGRNELLTDPCFAEMYANPKARMVTADDLVASMDEAGVDVSVAAAINWGDSGLCSSHNDYLIDAVKRYPGRIIGLGMVVIKPDASYLVELDRIKKGGLAGIGELRLDISGIDFEEGNETGRVMDYLAENDMVLMMHSSEPVGHLYPGKGKQTPEYIYPLVKKYPSVKIILGHLGGGLPFYLLQPEVKQDCRNVYYDTAALPYLYESRAYRLSAELAGVEKILFGSDFPLMKQQRALDFLDRAALSREDKERVLGLNARNLFGIKVESE
ncbi:MAG: amidohydrolase family protein [Dehalococcoidales bacterium]|jgi:predicted TIM-barrel fold metal-dependent hydrolase|nr:amidohydrolase family protein [Dehalococcoidales bacterium]